MRSILVLALLSSGATVPAQSPPATSSTVAAGPLQAELETRFVRELDRLASSLDGVAGYADLAGGSGVLQHLGTPSLSLRDHATLMIMVSDNSSTNIVINAVGMDKVNARMTALGLGDIRLRRLMMDAAAVKRGDENVASPQSLAKSAELLWKGEGLTPASRDVARGILTLVSGSIRRAVPSSVPVFAKTGGLDGVVTEAGVVAVPGRPFSIAVMTTYLTTADEGSRVVREMTAAAWSYFDRLAKGGAYGRK